MQVNSSQNSFLELAKKRFSVRKFTSQPVEQEKINLIINSAYVAPTACNNQPQKIFVLNTPGSIERIRKCTNCHFFAPTAILVCYDKNRCWHREYDNKSSGDIDASIVTTHMMLEASSIGIGSTWVMHFKPEIVRSEFNLPDNIEPVAILMMGYVADDAKPYPGHTEFRPLSELVETL